eukprot:gnl/MRDRNA2_/MRDRNA2_15778_c0_seq1.p1 gnl/MRDRNA2_/MRDRNA2_15778_c0~~gnl/MRDRNA2_/MRDRNA2_15778_c0_seq1.p1  ORF type:complete len:142 (-),score=34.68 gnl/MRDRNA2_/MRDRNA2_15778_c0_seq1:36-461(-)
MATSRETVLGRIIDREANASTATGEAENPVEITVVKMNGEALIKLSAKRKCSIGELKLRIAAVTHEAPVRQQRLIYGTNILKNDQTLDEIWVESTLTLQIALSQEFECEASATVEKLGFASKGLQEQAFPVDYVTPGLWAQ